MQEKLRTIEAFSHHHELSEGSEGTLPREDDLEAVRFFLERSFYGGRRVELSDRYFDHAEETIEDHRCLVEDVLDGSVEDGWEEPLREDLETEIGNSRDCEMVISLLEWLASDDDPETNVVQRSLRAIEEGRLDEHHRSVRENVYNVGPKKTSLYLRAVVSLADKEADVEGQWEYVIPIDTQIENVAGVVLGESIESESWKDSAQRIAEACREHNISPLDFDKGAWYVGSNTLAILLDCLPEIDPDSHDPV